MSFQSEMLGSSQPFPPKLGCTYLNLRSFRKSIRKLRSLEGPKPSIIGSTNVQSATEAVKYAYMCHIYRYIPVTGDLETCLSVALKPVLLLSYSWFYGITRAIFKILPLRIIWFHSLRFRENPMSQQHWYPNYSLQSHEPAAPMPWLTFANTLPDNHSVTQHETIFFSQVLGRPDPSQPCFLTHQE